jgi:anti-sigma factor RsiW
MTCKEVKEQFLDMTTASYTGAPAAEEHLRSCPACAGELASLRQTMALLEEWQAPEPSPYFNARLRARLREEPASRSFAQWLRDALVPFTSGSRKLVLAGSMAALVIVGVVVKETSGPNQTITTVDSRPKAGTAVGDLEMLDNNKDLYADFDLLDDTNGATVIPASDQTLNQ